MSRHGTWYSDIDSNQLDIILLVSLLYMPKERWHSSEIPFTNEIQTKRYNIGSKAVYLSQVGSGSRDRQKEEWRQRKGMKKGTVMYHLHTATPH